MKHNSRHELNRGPIHPKRQASLGGPGAYIFFLGGGQIVTENDFFMTMK